MCGLFGLARGTGRLTTKGARVTGDFLTALALLSEQRGDHSTGLAALKANGNGDIIKDAVPADRFVKRHAWKTLTRSKKAQVFIGHTRYATHGKRVRENAHPFQFPFYTGGHLTGAHNGVIRNSHDLNGERYAVDSANLFDTLAGFPVEEWREVLETAEGSFAISAAIPGAAVLARNTGSPLWTARVLGLDAIAWASEPKFLTTAAEAAGLRVSVPESVAPGTICVLSVKVKTGGPVITFRPFRLPAPKPTGFYRSSLYDYDSCIGGDEWWETWLDRMSHRHNVVEMPAPPAPPPPPKAEVATVVAQDGVKRIYRLCGGCGKWKEDVDAPGAGGRCGSCRWDSRGRGQMRLA